MQANISIISSISCPRDLKCLKSARFQTCPGAAFQAFEIFSILLSRHPIILIPPQPQTPFDEIDHIPNISKISIIKCTRGLKSLE